VELVGLLEFGDRLRHPVDLTQHVTIHVMGMRHRRRGQREAPRMRQGLGGLTDILVGMRQIVVHSEVVRCQRQGPLVVGE
jgi:hypothetical protein